MQVLHIIPNVSVGGGKHGGVSVPCQMSNRDWIVACFEQPSHPSVSEIVVAIIVSGLDLQILEPAINREVGPGTALSVEEQPWFLEIAFHDFKGFVTEVNNPLVLVPLGVFFEKYQTGVLLIEVGRLGLDDLLGPWPAVPCEEQNVLKLLVRGLGKHLVKVGFWNYDIPFQTSGLFEIEKDVLGNQIVFQGPVEGSAKSGDGTAFG